MTAMITESIKSSGPDSGAPEALRSSGQPDSGDRNRLIGHAIVLPWAREVPFQTVHSVSPFPGLSNNLGNLLFARRTTPTAVSDRVLMRF
jgi:hypothetical protein